MGKHFKNMKKDCSWRLKVDKRVCVVFNMVRESVPSRLNAWLKWLLVL